MAGTLPGGGGCLGDRMPGMSFEHEGAARRALAAIVSDPEHGTDALSDSRVIRNLLGDLLPDAPREAGVLIAAAEHDLAGKLREELSQGLDVESSVRLTAASFASSTAFSPEACLWAAGEMAMASGLARPGQIHRVGLSPPAELPPEPSASQAPTQSPTQPPGRAEQELEPTRTVAVPPGQPDGRRPGGPSRGWFPMLALAVVVGVALAGAAVALLLRLQSPAPRLAVNPASSPRSGRPAPPSASHSSASAPQPTSTGPSSPPSPISSTPGPSSSPVAPPPAAPSPRAVVEAYIAAINRRDWPRVWQLGGKNFSPSYAQMVAGYRSTVRDVITSVTVFGDTVTARFLAYQTTGAVQTYLVRYVVTDGVIVAAHATLLSGQ